MAHKLHHPTAHAAIDAALEAYRTPTSRLQRDIRQTLLSLRQHSESLHTLFDQRRAERASADATVALTTRARATALLEAQKALHAQHLDKANAELLAQSTLWLQLAEESLAVAETHIAAGAAVTRLQDTADNVAKAWLEALLVGAVDGLHADTSLDNALSIASGGLVVAGVAGGPLSSIAAALASAAQLAHEVRQLRHHGTEAREAASAREEAALQLMQVLDRLCHNWLHILARP